MAISRNYNLQDKQALAVALDVLRKSNRYLLSPINTSEIEDNPELNEYLLRPLVGENADVEKDKEFDKALASSIILGRDESTPLFIAEARAKAAIEELHHAKIVAQYESNTLSAKQYQQLSRDNWVSNIITRVKRAKRYYKRKGVRYGATALLFLAGAPYAGTIAIAGQIIWDILPTRTKEKIKDNTIKIVDSVKEKAKSSIVRLSEEGSKIAKSVAENLIGAVKHVAEKSQTIVEKVSPIIKSAIEVVSEVPVVKKTVEGVKKISQKIKSWLN